MARSVWIANSVGLLNMKAFLLFLAYTLLACAVAAAMLAREVVAFFSGPVAAAQPVEAGRRGALPPLNCRWAICVYVQTVTLWDIFASG